MIFLKRWKGILIFLYITRKGLAWFNMSFSEGNVNFCKHSVLLYRYYILFYILEWVIFTLYETFEGFVIIL